MSIAYQEPRTTPAETDITCPNCKSSIAPRLAVAVESVRTVAKRPATPELLSVGPGCQRLFVLSLQPVPESAS